MGTHPIFESDFDCLTDLKHVTRKWNWVGHWTTFCRTKSRSFRRMNSDASPPPFRTNTIFPPIGGMRETGLGCRMQVRPKKIRFIIDNLGRRSGTAQGLGKAITSFDRMNYGEQQLIYILRSEPAPVAVDDVGDSQQTSNPNKIFGFIKVGAKSLFVMDKQGQQLEVKSLCVLDFYVVEEMQRKGCGRRLFDFMLSDLSIRPAQLAVDRPSVKFKSFLRKHYSLSHTIPQINNFVIFDGFFRFNHSKRNRNRLTDDFSDRRRYQIYARGQSERRQSKTALPRLVAPEKPPEPELPVIPNPAARLVEKL